MAPVILIFPSFNGKETFLNKRYSDAVIYYGGIPLISPMGLDDAALSELCRRCDGFLFAGGVDLDPALYKEEKLNDTVEIDPVRDALEMKAVKYVLSSGKPVLGICRGIQSVNVGMGGSLVQDIPAQIPSALCHKQTQPGEEPVHKINIVKDSLLYKLFGRDCAMTNSFHHQSVKVPAEGLKISARCVDGITEALEGTGDQWLLLVQWHPEFNCGADGLSKAIFSAFINEAAKPYHLSGQEK